MTAKDLYAFEEASNIKDRDQNKTGVLRNKENDGREENVKETN